MRKNQGENLATIPCGSIGKKGKKILVEGGGEGGNVGGVGVLHSSSPHTSWPVNKMKRTLDSWRAEEGGGGVGG